MALNEGWEDQDWAEWSNLTGSAGELTIKTDRVKFGSYSGKIYSFKERALGPYAEWTFPNNEYDTVKFWYNEPSSPQFGSFLNVINGNGNRMIGAGTNNPQFCYSNNSQATVTNVYSGDGYNRWVRVTFEFSFGGGGGNVDIDWYDSSSGTTHTESNIALQNGGDIAGVRLDHPDNYDDVDGAKQEVWFDGLVIKASNSPPNASLSLSQV